MFKRIVCASGIALLVLLSGTCVHPAKAGGVLPYPPASEWTQVLNNVQLLGINTQTLKSLAESIIQSEIQTRMAQSINTQMYSQTAQQIDDVSSAVRVGLGLSYNMADLDAQWNTKYGQSGYQDPNNYGAQYQTWAQTSMDTTRGTLNAVTTQGQQINTDADAVTALQELAKGSVQGSLQAEQLMIQILAQQLGEEQKLRQLMLADLTSKETFQEQQLKQAAAGKVVGQMNPATLYDLPIDTSVTYPDSYLSAIGQKR